MCRISILESNRRIVICVTFQPAPSVYLCNMSKFSSIVQSPTPTLVDFYATWCGPCKTMHPILDDLKADLGESIRILKIDVDKNPAIADQFKIRGVPTLMLFKNGEVLWRESGAFPKQVLKSKLHAFL